MSRVLYFKPRGLFRECIGKRKGADGVTRPAIFWLGADRRAAEDAAERIIDDVVTTPGARDAEGVWTAEGLAAAEREIYLAKRCRKEVVAFAAQTLQQAALTLFEPPAWNPDAVAQLPQIPSNPIPATSAWSIPRRPAVTDPRFQVFERPAGYAGRSSWTPSGSQSLHLMAFHSIISRVT